MFEITAREIPKTGPLGRNRLLLDLCWGIYYIELCAVQTTTLWLCTNVEDHDHDFYGNHSSNDLGRVCLVDQGRLQGHTFIWPSLGKDTGFLKLVNLDLTKSPGAAAYRAFIVSHRQ